MALNSTIELTGLKLDVALGTYGPDDVVPDAHWLDLTLTIAPSLVLIDQDRMDRVFDYDPLIAEIDALAKERHYETQEYLMSRIVQACKAYPEIEAIDLHCYKTPVLGKSGALGVRLTTKMAEV